MMAFKYEQLKAMSLEELKRAYDESADSTVIGLGFLREEIARRESDEQYQRMVALTKQIRNMTLVILLLTVVNVAFVLVSLYK